MTDERRALLESIAFGSDAGIKPGERLRAVELLDGETSAAFCSCSELARLSDVELQQAEDHLMAALFIALEIDDLERRRRWPVTLAALENEVAQRVSERLRERSLPGVGRTANVG